MVASESPQIAHHHIKTDMHSPSKSHDADVAIIGMSCRFPGDATSPEAFLDMLKKGGTAWSEVPRERFDIDAYYHPSHDHRGTSVAKGGYFLKENPAQWDAPFCRLSNLWPLVDTNIIQSLQPPPRQAPWILNNGYSSKSRLKASRVLGCQYPKFPDPKWHATWVRSARSTNTSLREI